MFCQKQHHSPSLLAAAGKTGRLEREEGDGMKRELLGYLAGLCQAASAALMASAVIMPEARLESMTGCAASAVMGGIFIALRCKGA